MFSFFKKRKSPEPVDPFVKVEYNAVDNLGKFKFDIHCDYELRWQIEQFIFDELQSIVNDQTVGIQLKFDRIDYSLVDKFPNIQTSFIYHKDNSLFIDANGYSVYPEQPVWLVHINVAGPKITEMKSDRYFHDLNLYSTLMQLGIVSCVCSKKEKADEYYIELNKMYRNNIIKEVSNIKKQEQE